MTNTITMPRSVVEQALQSLHLGIAMYPNGGTAAVAIQATIDALRAALEQPQVEQEMVGEAGSMPGTDGFTMACFRASDVPAGTKLYTHPQPKPLTDEEITEITFKLLNAGASMHDFARAIEAAHGIGGAV